MKSGEGRRPPAIVTANFDEPVLLGEGGMGEVWRARERDGGAAVAVKVVRSHLVARAEVMARFRREVRVMERLRHPGVVQFRRVIEEGAEMALVLQYLEGRSLKDVLAEGPLPRERLLALGRELGAALWAVHAAGLVHRDLKPDNVMVRPDGTFVLMDFGLAGFQDPEAVTAMTRTGQLLGTPLYLSPEMLSGERCTARSDQYQLALVLHESATGEVPFPITSLAVISQRKLMGRLALFRGPAGEGVDGNLRAVVERALSVEPEERFEDMRALLRALEGGPSRGVFLDQKTLLTGVPRRRNRRRLAWALVVPVLCGALLAGLRRRVEGPPPVEEPSVAVTATEDEAGARRAYLTALDDLVARGLKRASDPSLRRPSPGVEAVWVHERILERMRPLPDVDRAQRTMEGLARERDRMLGLLDLALRGPRLSGDEAHRAWLAYEERLDDFTHVLRKFERYALRVNATWVVAATQAKVVSEGFMDELLALEARELESGEVPPEFVLSVVNCLQITVRPMDAAQRLERVGRELQVPAVAEGLWYRVLRLRHLEQLRHLRLREGEWRESCRLMDEAEALGSAVEGPDEVRSLARSSLVACLRAGIEGLIRGRLLPAEALQEGVVRTRRALAAFAEPGWVDLLHLPLLEALEEMGQEEEASRLRTQFAGLLAGRGTGR